MLQNLFNQSFGVYIIPCHTSSYQQPRDGLTDTYIHHGLSQLLEIRSIADHKRSKKIDVSCDIASSKTDVQLTIHWTGLQVHSLGNFKKLPCLLQVYIYVYVVCYVHGYIHTQLSNSKNIVPIFGLVPCVFNNQPTSQL